MNAKALLTPWTERAPLVLVVDVDADTRNLYAEYLRMSACTVEEAEDGREALAKAISHKPDIILTEMRLPGIDGVQLCELLRHDPVTAKIPIVIVTGDAYHVRRAESSGAEAVLLKPCNPETLLVTIYRLLDEPGSRKDLTRIIRDNLAQRWENPDGPDRTSPHRTILSRNYERVETTDPAAAPPALVCPLCDVALRYLRSYIGGVSIRHPEQWDYYECENSCGTFQYRQRTRKLRKISG